MASTLEEEEKFHPIQSDKHSDDIALGNGNKLMYDRDIPGYNPRDLQYCEPLADLAIDFYNKKNSTQYRVVELIRVIGVLCSGYYFCMKFTATDSDSDADAAAKTFGAEVHDGIEEITVESVDIVAEGVTLNVDALPARYF